jgi:hypothetical protein
MNMEKVKTRTALIWKDESEIFWIKLNADVLIDLEDITDNILVTRNITGNAPHLKLLDSRENWKMTEEAEAYYKREDNPEKTIARAILVNSVADKIIKSILLKLFTPKVPLKIFTSEREAVNWLLNFKK